MTAGEPEVIPPPAIGEPAWEGEITNRIISEIIGGTRREISQAGVKALAKEVRRLREKYEHA